MPEYTILKNFSFLGIGTLFLFFSVQPASAATITVDSTGYIDGVNGNCTIYEAIEAANTDAAVDNCTAGSGADTVTLNVTGTITFNVASDLEVTEEITIDGPGADQLTIDADGLERVFRFDSPTDDQTHVLSGLTLTGGDPGVFGEGGAINVADGDTLNISDCVITGNTALVGGGIQSLGELQITDCIISNNTATEINAGGGVNISGDPLNNNTIIDSTFEGNLAPFGYGGGLEILNTSVTIEKTTFNSNNAGLDGGGIAFNGNTVNASLTNVTISGNTANGEGGGIAIFNNASATIVNSTVAFNTADNDNNGMGDGGGISVIIAELVFKNTIVSDNADMGGQSLDCSGLVTSDDYNLISNTGGCIFGGVTANNITGISADLEPLSLNAPGTTETHAILAGSPAIDAGTNTGAPATDQRGVARPQDGDGDTVDITDIGAYEFDNGPPTLAEVTPVPTPDNDATPSYTFSTTEGGDITYGGDCSSATTTVNTGNNTIIFNTLSEGTHSNCTITVTDSLMNESDPLTVTSFTLDLTAPVLTQVTAVPSSTSDTTPNYTFSTTEAGDISYTGDCSSNTTNASMGNNTITFNTLATGSHTNCTITVTDDVGNESDILNINSFTITSSSNSGGSGGGGCVSCGGVNPSPFNQGPSPSPAPSPIPAPTPSPTPTPIQPNIFTDITGHWVEQYIMNLKKTCGITGYLDSTGKPLNLFKPDASISRAELITMVIKCRYGELTSVSEKPFSDVPVEHWAAPYIAKAKELKTVEGFEDGTFGTDLNASRAEALKMILLANFSQTEIENAQADNACNDIQSDAWYRQIFYFGLNKNIIGGFKDLNGNLTGECAPDHKVSRAEASKMMIEASEK